MNTSRRDFVKDISQAAGLCCMVGSAAVLLDGCSSMKYVQYQVSEKNLVVKKVDVLGAKYFAVNVDSLDAPIYINFNEEEEYKALLMLCTHKQCQLKSTGSYLTCPCHGSEFSAEGKVLKGPAKANLKEYLVKEDDEHIYIYVG